MDERLVVGARRLDLLERAGNISQGNCPLDPLHGRLSASARRPGLLECAGGLTGEICRWSAVELGEERRGVVEVVRARSRAARPGRLRSHSAKLAWCLARAGFVRLA